MFEGIDHIGAPTWNADAAAAFYEAAGIPVAFEQTIDEYGIHAVFIGFDGVYLEFLEPTGDGPSKEFLERHGNGYQHIAYRVSDIDSAVASLRADGITFQSDEPIDGIGNARVIFVEERHTAGLQVELVERNGMPAE
ncbi:MAG: VOC family protein [Halobacteriota archaeon]|uniref:VOC family protein n=1 Tax=Natronomonas sp. TaxID=2184060 RepID=UPI003974FD17